LDPIEIIKLNLSVSNGPVNQSRLQEFTIRTIQLFFGKKNFLENLDKIKGFIKRFIALREGDSHQIPSYTEISFYMLSHASSG